jgi:hypothetical protein
VDDDFKISMNDIKDMVSELFGEKVEKVGTDEARKILKQEMLEFFETSLEGEPESSGVLSEEEERLLKEFEDKKDNLSGAYAILSEEAKKTDAAPKITGNNALFSGTQVKPPIEAPVKAKESRIDSFGLPPVDGELKLKPPLPRVTEEERLRKREETLKKMEESKRLSAAYQASFAGRTAQDSAGLSTTHSEKAALLSMFEQTQKVFSQLLAKLIKRKPVDTMMVRTLEKAIVKNQDVLKKANVNQGGKIREDGSMEIPRVTANMNALMFDENKRTEIFLSALRQLFDERLIAAEIATSIEVKDEIISAIMMQIDKIFDKNNYSKKLRDIFVEYIVPSTTLKPGE